MYAYSLFSKGTQRPLRMCLNTPVWRLLLGIGLLKPSHVSEGISVEIPRNPSSVYYFHYSGDTGHLLCSFLLHWSLAPWDESPSQVDCSLEAQVLTWVKTSGSNLSKTSRKSLIFPKPRFPICGVGDYTPQPQNITATKILEIIESIILIFCTLTYLNACSGLDLVQSYGLYYTLEV